MHRFPFVGLIVGTALLLLSCGSEEKTGTPVPPPAKQDTLPPLEGPMIETDPPVWVPKDYEMIGRWERPCHPVTEGAATAGREELHFDDSKILLTSYRFSESQCSAASQLSAANLELEFEEGWNPSAPQVNGIFVKGWRGTFREKKNGEFVDYETSAHLVRESGKKVLYIRWSTKKPVLLDAADRYLWAGTL